VSVTIYEPGIESLVHDPNGGVSHFLTEVAESIVLADAHDAVSIRWPGGSNPVEGPNQGRPYARSYNLWASMYVGTAQHDDRGLVVPVIADAVSPHEEYGLELRRLGYKYLPERDYYHYVEQGV
jgi:hypothetical protein